MLSFFFKKLTTLTNQSRVFLGSMGLVIFCLTTYQPVAYANEKHFNALFNLSFSELLKTEVTSVSKSAQSIKNAAAAIYVISEEDIRRSGVNTIPEALRMVPGINVAQLDASKWAISSRGFNRIYGKYLLVLVDGRSVYSPLFGGVHWDAQDYILKDIKRIEVIRGPGAALWGANAVNGVINIITKRASETQGIFINLEAGNKQKIFSARHGGKIKNKGEYRFYAKAREENNSSPILENTANDAWDMFRTGFRTDWRRYTEDAFTLQGDYYTGKEGEFTSYPTITPPYRANEAIDSQVSGLNLLARWTKTHSSTSEWILQSYFDRVTRKEKTLIDHPFAETHNTFDIDLQHRIQVGLSQKITWGVNFRYIQMKTESSLRFGFSKDYRTTKQGGLFVQNEINLLENILSATLGSKIEYFDLTGFEVQPNVRLAWTPTPKNTVWASVARAVSNPARIDNDAIIMMNTSLNDQCGPGVLCARKVLGNPNIRSEKLEAAYEMGFRSELYDSFSFDIAIFYNKYNDLISTKPETKEIITTPIAYETLPQRFINASWGTTKGIELSSIWQATSTWRLLAGLTFLKMDIEATDRLNINTNSPEKQLSLRSYYNISRNIELDTSIYFVDDISIVSGRQRQAIDKYWRIDFHLTWSPHKKTNIVFGIRNLLKDKHQEFSDVPFILATQIERNIYAKLVLRY